MWPFNKEKKVKKPTSGELMIKHMQSQLPEGVFIMDDTESMPKDAQYDHRITFIVNANGWRIEFSDNSDNDGELTEEDKHAVEKTLMVPALEALYKDMGNKITIVERKLEELRR